MYFLRKSSKGVVPFSKGLLSTNPGKCCHFMVGLTSRVDVITCIDKN